jgi:hypothetical protein
MMDEADEILYFDEYRIAPWETEHREQVSFRILRKADKYNIGSTTPANSMKMPRVHFPNDHAQFASKWGLLGLMVLWIGLLIISAFRWKGKGL